MTKLNYVNRKSEGIKLGHIVAKDLRKRIKQTTPPKNESHKDSSLDLLLDGKNLTDDGLSEMARGLEEALSVSADPHRTRLRVLSLCGNDLTARSLFELAPSIRAAANDLEELDLSSNSISVSTENHVHYWQTFLESLRQVQKLTLLNLCGSDLSNMRALEVFTRIYELHFHENRPTLEHLADEVHDMSVNEFSLPERLHSFTLQPPNGHTESNGDDATNGARARRIRGIPSIAIIKVSNVGLTDFGALFLSYPLVQHQWIHDHILGSVHQFRASGPTAHGIIHFANESLSSVGGRMLKLAETVFYDPPTALPPVPENSPMSRNDSVDSGQGRRASSAYQHMRKTSMGSTPTEVTGKSPGGLQNHADDLESLRKKIQRTILEDKGPFCVELWSAALRLLSYARQIMVEENATAFLISQATSPTSMEALPTRRPSPSFQDINVDNFSFSPSQLDPPKAPSTHAARPTVNVEQAGVLAAPETPQIFHHPRHRRDSFSYHSNSSSPGNKATGEARASVLKAVIRMTNPEKPRLIGPFPERVWTIILAELADPKRVMSRRQVQSVVKWARDRATLAIEREALGKPDSVRIWRALEGMGCLEYDGRM